MNKFKNIFYGYFIFIAIFGILDLSGVDSRATELLGLANWDIDFKGMWE